MHSLLKSGINLRSDCGGKGVCGKCQVEVIFAHSQLDLKQLTRMVVVGNPAMIHIFLGISPYSIGISPYQPAFFDARQTKSSSLGFTILSADIHTLGQAGGVHWRGYHLCHLGNRATRAT